MVFSSDVFVALPPASSTHESGGAGAEEQLDVRHQVRRAACAARGKSLTRTQLAEYEYCTHFLRINEYECGEMPALHKAGANAGVAGQA